MKSVAELTAYAKANPGKLNYGAAGPINLTNLAGELYKLKAGLDFVAVHFKSGAELLTCVSATSASSPSTTSPRCAR